MKNGDFTIFPAIHLRDGEVVRFTQGDINNPVVFHTDPLACAQQWMNQGISDHSTQFEKLKKIEIALINRDPYKQIAQYFQLIAKKR